MPPPSSTQEKKFRTNFHVFLATILAISRLTSTPKPDSNLRQCNACSLSRPFRLLLIYLLTADGGVLSAPNTQSHVQHLQMLALCCCCCWLAGLTPTGATGMSHLVNPGCRHDRRDGRGAGCLSCKLQYIGIYTPKSVHVKLLLVIFLLPMSQSINRLQLVEAM